MPTAKSPCKNCPDRYVGCHGQCDSYQTWKAKYSEWTESVSTKRKKEIAPCKFMQDNSAKRKKRRN